MFLHEADVSADRGLWYKNDRGWLLLYYQFPIPIHHENWQHIHVTAGKATRKNAEDDRPIIVKFKDEETKARSRTNLVSLRNSEEPYKHMRIQHDLTSQERRKTERTANQGSQVQVRERGGFFFYIVRGLQGNRKIVKVPRRRIAREERDEEEEDYW